jgi:phage/plasmid-associated DNA primase
MKKIVNHLNFFTLKKESIRMRSDPKAMPTTTMNNEEENKCSHLSEKNLNEDRDVVDKVQVVPNDTEEKKSLRECLSKMILNSLERAIDKRIEKKDAPVRDVEEEVEVIIEEDESVSLKQFVEKYKVSKAKTHSHVSIIDKACYYLDYKVIDDFWNLYCDKFAQNQDIIHSIAEQPSNEPNTFIPIIVDIDLKLEAVGEPMRLYNEEDVITLIEIFQEQISEIFTDIENQDFNCFLLEKPPRRDGKNIKSGFHLHFPIFVRRQAILNELYPRVIKKIDEVGLFKDCGGSEVLDKGMPTKPQLVYGGRKSQEQKSYICSKAYNSQAEEFKYIDEALQDYKLYDSKGNLLPANIHNLPRIFSSFINNRQIHEVKLELIKKQKVHAQITEYTTEEIEQNLEKASTRIPLLSSKRANIYDDWMRIGYILFNISEGNQRGLDMWIGFSKRTTRQDVYPEADCKREWLKMKKGTLTLGSLNYYAKQDSPDEYVKLASKYFPEEFQISHVGIAELLKEHFSDRFIYSSDDVLMCFNGRTWEAREDVMRLTITGDLLNLISDLQIEKMSEIRRAIAEEKDKYVIKQLNSVLDYIKKSNKELKVKYLGNVNFVDGVIKHAKVLFRNDKIEFDNKNLLGFDNCVYDPETDEFRDYRYDDYISITNGLTWSEPTEEAKAIVDSLFYKFQPDPAKRKLALIIFSTGMTTRRLCKFNMFYGNGSNLKSTMIALLNMAFGRHSIVASNTILWETKKMGACPEMANLNKKRSVSVSEIPEDKMLDVATIKTLTGDKTVPARGLFEKNTEQSSRMTLQLFCNSKPKLNGKIDKAVVRRIIAIGCNSIFVENENEVDEKNHIYKIDTRFDDENFLSTIVLAFIQKFMRAYQEYKLADYEINGFIPDCVRKDTEEYLLENDEISAWWEENFKPDKTKDSTAYQCPGTIFDDDFADSIANDNLKKKGKNIGKNGFIDYFRKHELYRKKFKEEAKINGKHVKKVLIGYKRRTFKNKGTEIEEEED